MRNCGVNSLKYFYIQFVYKVICSNTTANKFLKLEQKMFKRFTALPYSTPAFINPVMSLIALKV